MDYKIFVMDSAHADFRAVSNYIARTLKNPIAAANLLNKAEACYEELRQFPFLYEACRNPFSQEQNCRRVVIDNYVLIYRVDRTERTVYILRFLYGSRDYDKII